MKSFLLTFLADFRLFAAFKGFFYSPNDMDHKNEGSSMLSDEQNMNIFGQLGDECYVNFLIYIFC